MRLVGHLKNEAEARLFGDYLYVRGIENELESERDGSWGLWVRDEDKLGQAHELFQIFRSNPKNPEFGQTAQRASQLRAEAAKRNQDATKKYFDRSQIFRDSAYGLGQLTLGLIAVSIVVYLLRTVSGEDDFGRSLFISEVDFRDTESRLKYGLPEVRKGQVWRVVTPIFLHFHILHILFNMLWLKDLGSMIEARKSSLYLGSMILSIGVASNLAQYYMSGPLFGGMSGVVYGLLGFIWMKSRFDPSSGFYLHPTTVAMMLIWFVFCFSGFLPIANTVHTVGLVMGVGWGYLSAMRPFSR